MNVQNKKQNFNFAQFDMLNVCVDMATSPEHQPITDLIPDFKSCINTAKSNLTIITGLIASEKQVNTGTAQQKRQLKNALADKMFQVSNPFSAWASGKNDLELYNSFSNPVSSYKRMRPAVIISNADRIISTITPLLPSLIGTSINQDSLDAIADARNAFAPFASRVRGKIVFKNDKLTQMVSLLKTTMDLTRSQLDRLAAGFLSINQNSYYNEWVRSRKLVPYGTLTTRASIDIYMGDANSPVQNALVKIDGTTLQGTTDDKGHTTISRVPYKGEQNITVTAPGFENPVHAGPYTFKKGKATHIIINMNEFNIPAPVNENTNSDVPA